jgi:hypothetical protein
MIAHRASRGFRVLALDRVEDARVLGVDAPAALQMVEPGQVAGRG